MFGQTVGLLYNFHRPLMQIEYIWRESGREVTKCVSLPTEGEAHTCPYSLPRCSASPCCCLCYWIVLTFKYSVKNALTAGASVCSRARARVCVWYDKEAVWNHSPAVKAGGLFIGELSSFAGAKLLFANVATPVEKPLTSEIEIYTVLHSKE